MAILSSPGVSLFVTLWEAMSLFHSSRSTSVPSNQCGQLTGWHGNARPRAVSQQSVWALDVAM